MDGKAGTTHPGVGALVPQFSRHGLRSIPVSKTPFERINTDPRASAFYAGAFSSLHNVPQTTGDRRYLLIDGASRWTKP
jgi:hypothetical protein